MLSRGFRTQKVYYHHTGYPGGMKERRADKLLDGRFPERVIEAAVRTGREERDLLTRLGTEIDRARRLYEERVPASAGHYSFFQQELVQTLAEGDAALLGEPA